MPIELRISIQTYLNSNVPYILTYKSHFWDRRSMRSNQGCDLYGGHTYSGGDLSAAGGIWAKIMGATYMQMQPICDNIEIQTTMKKQKWSQERRFHILAVIHAPSIISASPFWFYLSFKFCVKLWENAFEYKRTPIFCSTSIYKCCVYDRENTVSENMWCLVQVQLSSQTCVKDCLYQPWAIWLKRGVPSSKSKGWSFKTEYLLINGEFWD